MSEVQKVYNDKIFVYEPRLKREDIKVGMRVALYQLDDIKDLYITLDDAIVIMDKIHSISKEGTITRISKEDGGWKTSDTASLVINTSMER